MTKEERYNLIGELTAVINRYSLDTETNTADFALAAHLVDYIYTLVDFTHIRDGWNNIPEQMKNTTEV